MVIIIYHRRKNKRYWICIWKIYIWITLGHFKLIDSRLFCSIAVLSIEGDSEIRFNRFWIPMLNICFISLSFFGIPLDDTIAIILVYTYLGNSAAIDTFFPEQQIVAGVCNFIIACSGIEECANEVHIEEHDLVRVRCDVPGL